MPHGPVAVVGHGEVTGGFPLHAISVTLCHHWRGYGYAHYRWETDLPGLREGPFHHLLRFLRVATVPRLPQVRHVAAGLRVHPDEGLLCRLRDEPVGKPLGQHDGLMSVVSG